MKRVLSSAIVALTALGVLVGGCSPADDPMAAADAALKAKDFKRAAMLLEQACDAGLGDACMKRIELSGHGDAPADDAATRKWAHRACDAGSAKGCLGYGAMLMAGRGGNKDVGEGVTYFKKSCDGGFLPGCSMLAAADLAGAPGHSPAEGRALADQTCKKGESSGCVIYARALYDGSGGNSDTAAALAYFQANCAKAMDACVGNFDLAGIDQYSGPVARDFIGAACSAGRAYSCTDLGAMMRDGRSGAVDAAQARVEFDKACQLGDGGGCLELANLLRAGTGGAVDYDRAWPLYDKACKSGLADGCAARQEMATAGQAPPPTVTPPSDSSAPMSAPAANADSATAPAADAATAPAAPATETH